MILGEADKVESSEVRPVLDDEVEGPTEKVSKLDFVLVIVTRCGVVDKSADIVTERVKRNDAEILAVLVSRAVITDVKLDVLDTDMRPDFEAKLLTEGLCELESVGEELVEPEILK